MGILYLTRCWKWWRRRCSWRIWGIVDGERRRQVKQVRWNLNSLSASNY